MSQTERDPLTHSDRELVWTNLAIIIRARLLLSTG